MWLSPCAVQQLCKFTSASSRHVGLRLLSSYVQNQSERRSRPHFYKYSYWDSRTRLHARTIFYVLALPFPSKLSSLGNVWNLVFESYWQHQRTHTRHTYGSCMLRQGSCQLCQVFCLQMLSTAGKQLVQSNMAQKASLLFPPGTESLPDIVTNYSSLKGSDKWTLQSIMLLVFRPVLRDVRSMVRLHVCLVHHHKTMRVYKLTNVYLDDSSDSNRQGSSCGCGVVLSTYGFITGTAQTHEKKSLQPPRNVL